jgi:hypothetical protein
MNANAELRGSDLAAVLIAWTRSQFADFDSTVSQIIEDIALIVPNDYATTADPETADDAVRAFTMAPAETWVGLAGRIKFWTMMLLSNSTSVECPNCSEQELRLLRVSTPRDGIAVFPTCPICAISKVGNRTIVGVEDKWPATAAEVTAYRQSNLPN